MAVKIQLRRGTASEWTSANPVLSSGEAGFETDTRQFKIGDGTTAWNSLNYYATGTITGVTTASGSGLTGGGTTGSLTLAVDPTVVITKNYVGARGDLITATANDTPSLLGIGTDNYVLVAEPSNGGNATGLKWAQVTADGIASNAVTTAKIADSNVTLAKLASAVQDLLIPAGTVAATVKSTADTGWLLLNGATVTNAQSTYPSLWAVSPAAWKSGSSLVLPNLAGRTLFGQGTTTLGATGGSNTITIGESNLPPHAHTITHSHTGSASISDPGHSHAQSGNNGGSGFPYRIPGSGSDDVYNSGSGVSVTWHVNPGTASATTGISASVTVNQHTGSSGNGNGTTAAITVTNAHLAVNYQIKAH